jgi:hypothetical protein
MKDLRSTILALERRINGMERHGCGSGSRRPERMLARHKLAGMRRLKSPAVKSVDG